MPLWVHFALILVGSLAILVEFFIPALGMVGIAGLVTVVVSVILGFAGHSEPWGFLLLITALLVTPSVLIGGFKRFPKSFFGRRLILTSDEATEVERSGVVQGDRGEAVTDLHPSGVALFDGERKSVVTGGEYIDRGTPVEVVAVEGARIVVRRKSDGD
ncbi:MAG: NfeD family protein [Alkalispirochaetaceae bacterium]